MKQASSYLSERDIPCFLSTGTTFSLPSSIDINSSQQDLMSDDLSIPLPDLLTRTDGHIIYDQLNLEMEDILEIPELIREPSHPRMLFDPPPFDSRYSMV